MKRIREILGRGKKQEELVAFARLGEEDNDANGGLHNGDFVGDSPSSLGAASPEEAAGALSRLLFWYVTPLIRLGSRKTLEVEDLWQVSHKLGDRATTVASSFESHKQSIVRDRGGSGGGDDDGGSWSSQSPRLWYVLCATHWRKFTGTAALKLVHDVVELSGPYWLQRLLDSLQGDSSKWVSAGFATVMALAAFAQALIINQYFHILYRISTHCKVQLVSCIYRKALRISTSALHQDGDAAPAKGSSGGKGKDGAAADKKQGGGGAGKINNLQSNDAAKIWNLPQYLHQVWNAPLKIAVIMTMLSHVLGVLPAFVGLCVTIVMVPMGAIIARKLAKTRKELMSKTDCRVKLVTELVNGIKAVKLYAWETAYVKKIRHAREQELRLVRRVAYLSIGNQIVFYSTPVLVALAAFWSYALRGRTLTADVAFPALSLFNILRFPVLMLPMQISNIINARVSFRRVQEFLDREEKEEAPQANASASTPGSKGKTAASRQSMAAVTVRNGDFAWSLSSPPQLKNINLEVNEGELLMVVGQVGSGKSSILAAILSEMKCRNGGVSVVGSVAYTSQEPWIQNATLKQNIVISSPGGEVDEKRYEAVLDACALRPDLDVLPGGDMAEIGEKGINISGGQKHRIALARAVYSDADIYLLDDPLSAVDAHVSGHIFKECIQGEAMLGGKTRILVTHQVQYAPQVDRVVVVKDGCIEKVGTYEELRDSGVNFHLFESHKDVKDGKGVDDRDDGASDDSESKTDSVDKREEEQRASDAPAKPTENGTSTVASASTGRSALVKAEERSRGRVKTTIYLRYIRSWGAMFILPAAYACFAVLERGLQVGQNFVLADWSESDASGVTKYLNIYTLFAAFSLVFTISRAFCLANGTVSASRYMHNHLLEKMVTLPMSFFDAQPSGRLINRFTRDTESLDSTIGQSMNSFVVCATSTVFALFVVAYVTPLVILLILPIIILYVKVQMYYIGASRELKRLDSLAMSPIFSNFIETLQGLSVIRAFGLQNRFDEKNLNLLNNSNRAYWPLVSSNRWLSVRLEFLGSSITYFCALLSAVYSAHSAGMSGLAITSAMNVTSLMTWMVRQVTELEVNMNSVERLTEYDSEPSEGSSKSSLYRDVSPSWPQKGAISFENVVVKYRPELPSVLKGLTFEIEGCEKVGVCGRTGSGKSTMMMALYRMVEPSGGRICIDGLDICQMSLFDLRTKLSLVPQDPVIFSGTVRSNLDPFNDAKDDAEIWDALRLSGMKDVINNLQDKKGLDSVISEGGSNLSVGQRQLLCMARSLIRKSKILMLDEATSNVDSETDQLLQNTIRSAFSKCTVLTIAHRLHTIIDADKVLVLQGGELGEYDTPKNLLKNEDGMFYAMVQKATQKKMNKTNSAKELTNFISKAKTSQ
eukprot:CAMPEP_0198246788 /NCGR_PEP_ID=MMETSP1446-20131203/46149_1 /TAXON_ID=1461542 ORGANISM="Unidentified sp, Strain CCMP2111" /NCGR_SAMPLE_ID=MMETSP1446 /ASSEMBLY_ACC=CAM_ASM_001112 /LENGTH=1394 /DNA_ID=CAMNT_0043931111 /DNA_START=581 /DNA_END=4768 /DNA_ORIENTATION=+